MPILDDLAKATGLLPAEILKIVSTAPRRYKEYTIDKRSGGKRLIAQPARELKRLQYEIIDILLKKLPVHVAATAYRKSVGIRENVVPHVKNRYILKLDFKNFFNSIKSSDFIALCTSRAQHLDSTDVTLLANCLFWKPKDGRDICLSVGAPTSPLLSNAIMYNYDTLVSSYCDQRRISYTRYADDVTLSCNNMRVLIAARKFMHQSVAEMRSPNISYNHDKEALVTKKYHRTVTGLTITNDGAISIGHDRKRLVSSMVHRHINGHPDKPDIKELRGLLAFINTAEPVFLNKLKIRYGEENILKILHGKKKFLGQ